MGVPPAGLVSWQKPAITYTRADSYEVTKTFSQHPVYSWAWTSKANHVVTDGGIVEKQIFHQRKVHRLSFEMLQQDEADWVRQWWNERGANGYEFTFYRFGLNGAALTCIISPGETEPKVGNMEGTVIWWTWDVEFWEVLT